MNNKNNWPAPLAPLPQAQLDPSLMPPGEMMQYAEEKNGIFARIGVRIQNIREGYSGLSESQKNILQMGALAVLPSVLPGIEVMTNGDHAESAGEFLKTYAKLGVIGTLGAANYGLFRITKHLKRR